MKNIVILVIALVIGFFIYQQVQKPSDVQPTSVPLVEQESVETEPAAVDTTSLISSSPDNADVFILEPGDGSTVTSPVTIKFGITNMKVLPAGTNEENSGHHHLLIDMDELPDMTQPLPATDQLIHFGGGQTETSIDLEPGEHTLQLLLGNYLHIPHAEPVISKKITIMVK